MLYTSLPSRTQKTVNKPISTQIKQVEITSIKLAMGMTLLELIIGLCITSILTSIALPNFNVFLVKIRVDKEISSLSRLLSVARNHSINSGSNVIICPLENGTTCSTNWHEELSVFIDNNNNKKLDVLNNELLITTKAPIKSGDILKYATNRSKITYQPTGHLFGLSNGTFRYCPKGFDEIARGVVVARSGRFYATNDDNGDGRDKTRSNNLINCE